MDFICPTCGKNLPRELMVDISHTEQHVIDQIKKEKPGWVETDGICKKCYAYYKDQLHPKSGNS